MLFATAPLKDILANFTRLGWNGPLYHLLLREWIALLGTSMYAMRFLSLIFGVLCVPLMYVLGCRLADRRVGFLAALLVTTSPYLTWYSQELKMYSLVLALTLLAIYALRRAVDGGGGWWWGVQIVATSLAFYFHILAALLIPVQILIFLCWWPRDHRTWLGALASLLCFLLPYIPLASWHVPLLFQDSVFKFSNQPLWQILDTILANWRTGNVFLLRSRVTGFSQYSLGEIVRILINGWSIGYFGSFGLGWPYGVILMVTLLVWGNVSFLFRNWPKRLGKYFSLLCWLILPTLLIWYISQRQPLFTDRYLIWSSPAFYLLIAVGLADLWRTVGWGRWAAIILTVLVLGLNGVNQYQQAVKPGKADFRAAAAYVAATYAQSNDEEHAVDVPLSIVGCDHCEFEIYFPKVLSRYTPLDELIIFQIPYGRYTFDYYFPYQNYPWAEGLYTNHRASDGAYLMSEQAAHEAMRHSTEGYTVVWLVASEMSMWDERELVRGWLDRNMQLTDDAEYLWVSVYRYERPPSSDLK
jgi:hypothetical protein